MTADNMQQICTEVPDARINIPAPEVTRRPVTANHQTFKTAQTKYFLLPIPPLPLSPSSLAICRKMRQAYEDKVAAQQKKCDHSFFLRMGRYRSEDSVFYTSPDAEIKSEISSMLPPPATHACATCGKLFTSKVGLGSHQKHHKVRYHCSHCKLPFSNKKELARHMVSTHNTRLKKASLSTGQV